MSDLRSRPGCLEQAPQDLFERPNTDHLPGTELASQPPLPPVTTPQRTARPGLVDLICEAATVPTDEGRAYIEECKKHGPYRRARRSPYNGTVRLASEKEGATREAESLSNEYALLLELEHDPRVEAFYPQPQPLRLSYDSAAGHRVVTPYTPDVLVVLKDGRATLVEAKLLETAERECAAGNPRFSREEPK